MSILVVEYSAIASCAQLPVSIIWEQNYFYWNQSQWPMMQKRLSLERRIEIS